MKVGIPKEKYPDEQRVAMTPDVAPKLLALGFSVAVETGAGTAASYSDNAYREAGADIMPSAKELWAQCDIMLKVRAPERDEVELLKSGQTLIGFFWPAQNPKMLKTLADRGVTVLAMDSIPRLSRAQKMDALSSMANVGGYRAVIEAAEHFGRFFTGQVTAAGRVEPAKVLVIGAGVAGLSAIGTAGGMGAIVRGFDTRPEVKEQIESLNAQFLALDVADEDGSGEDGYAKVMSEAYINAEMALFAEQAKEVDIIITTALVHGKPAPKLITADMIGSMKPGSVVVDLAAEQGGNCELTVPGELVIHGGVTIIGYTDLPSRMASQSSQLYATNLMHLLAELTPEKDGQIVLNMDDDVIRGATICTGGKITWPPPAPKLTQAPKKKISVSAPAVKIEKKKKISLFGPVIAVMAATLILLGLGTVAPPNFMAHLKIFVLASFVAYMVVWNVSPTLHTSLMSMNNAISSVIVVGALLQVSAASEVVKWVAVIAIFFTSINILGGFAVTHRMLKMFRKSST